MARLPLTALTALTALAVGMVGARGRSSKSGARPAPPPVALSRLVNACALLPPSDAREILGGEVSRPTTSNLQGADERVSQCAYASPTPHRFLSLVLREASTATAAGVAYDHARAEAKALTGREPLDISEVGERAYWTGGTFKQLTVLEKNLQLIVSVDLGDGRDRVEGTKTVARKALTRYGELRAP